MDRLRCLLLGHRPYRIKWKHIHRISTKRKGGRKKGKGIFRWSTKHYADYCQRCGKLLRKR